LKKKYQNHSRVAKPVSTVTYFGYGRIRDLPEEMKFSKEFNFSDMC